MTTEVSTPTTEWTTRSGSTANLTVALAAVTLIGAGTTAVVPSLLSGPAVMVGSARGTAAVMCLISVPVLLAGFSATRRGSHRARVLWLGAAAHLVYNAVMLLFATPFNPLFLLYVAQLGLGVAVLAAVTAGVDLGALASRMSAAPVRGIAVYVWVIVAANVLAWLRAIVPALGESTERRPDFLVEAGLTTNPLYVQDLALWLPLAAVGAWWLWQRRPAGYLVTGTILVLWVIEGVTVAVDQWWGSTAAPESTIASIDAVVPFATLALVGLIPLALLVRTRRPAVTPR